MLLDWFNTLQYDPSIKERVKGILEKAEQGDMPQFEQEISRLALDLLSGVEQGVMSPQLANDHFMVVDLYITKRDLRDKLSEPIQDLMFQGLLFHDWGTNYGPDVELIRKLASFRGKR